MSHNSITVRAFGIVVALAALSSNACVSGGDEPSRGAAGEAGSSGSGGSGGSENVEGCIPLELEPMSAAIVPGWVQARWRSLKPGIEHWECTGQSKCSASRMSRTRTYF